MKVRKTNRTKNSAESNELKKKCMGSELGKPYEKKRRGKCRG